MRGYRDEINDAFWRFHAEHPEVYRLFDRFVTELIAKGHKRGSAKQVIERIRWETNVATAGPVKINNNYTSRYARLWESDNPAHRGFFRRRALNPVSANSIRVPADERREARA